MRRYINIAFIYAICAMIAGVFFREFTKFSGYTDATYLSKMHPHLFILGMVMFLLVALLKTHIDFEGKKTFRFFMGMYNIGVPLTAIMMLVRGVLEVKGVELTSAAQGAISGIAGLGHAFVGVGIILLFIALRESTKNK